MRVVVFLVFVFVFLVTAFKVQIMGEQVLFLECKNEEKISADSVVASFVFFERVFFPSPGR